MAPLLESWLSISLSTSPQLTVHGLYRYAVKGLSGDQLQTVNLQSSCFPDDRRYALLREDKESWNEGEWLHKENFLCAFTAPELLASFQSTYKIEEDGTYTRRILELKDRKSGTLLLGPLHLETDEGRKKLADFLSLKSGQKVVCVTSQNGDFQFGNTSSGFKHGDSGARTIHVSQPDEGWSKYIMYQMTG